MAFIKAMRKAVAQLRLLCCNPEKFLRNLKQFTNKTVFLNELLDMPQIRKLDIQVTANPDGSPLAASVNVLLPRIGPSGMTGGPNTVLLIAALLAHSGVPVRFVSCDAPLLPETEWFWIHLSQLTGIAGRPSKAVLRDAFSSRLQIGADDLVLASFWTTAYQAADMVSKTRRDEFIYIIQDFEPGFYSWSSHYALASASLNLRYHAVVNERTLADFLFESQIGRFSEPDFKLHCTVFEPAIDSRLFAPAVISKRQSRRMLVYARPTNPRNLLGLAVAALRAAVATPSFEGDWEFLAIGARGSLPPVPLGSGKILKEAPWRDLAGYAALLQDADVLLSPMLSPHTSYPVLEMAACSRLVVTTSFATKTTAYLTALSPNIVAVEATVEGLTRGLIVAAGRVEAGEVTEAVLKCPDTWEKSLGDVNNLVRKLLITVPDEARLQAP